MLKKRLILAVIALFATQPLMAQEWLDRYLRERREKEEAATRELRRQREEHQQREQQRQQAQQAQQAPTPVPTSLNDVMQGQQPRQPQPSGVEVRRGVPLEPFNPPPAAPVETEEEIPRAERVYPEMRTSQETLVPPAAPAPPVPPIPPAPEAEEEIPVALPVNEAELAAERPPAAVPPPAEEAGEAEPAEDAPPAPGAETGAPGAPAESAEAAPEAAPTPQETEEEKRTLRLLDPTAGEIRLSPGTTSAPPDVVLFHYANTLYNQRQYDLAAPEFERYLNAFPRGGDRQAALFRLAESYRRMGSFNAARRHYEGLIYNFQVGDFIGPASYRLAELYYQEKDYTAAVTFFRKASVWVKDPSIALSAKFYAARALQAGRMTSEAIRGYEDVLSFDEAIANPFREACLLALSDLYDASGRHSSALKTLVELKTETQKPSVKAEATARLGLLYLNRKEYKKAEAELREALSLPEIGPWRSFTETALLRLCYAEGRYADVLTAYQASEKRFAPEEELEVLLTVANSHRQLKQVKEATAIYDRIIATNPESPYAADAEYERLVILYNGNSPELLAAVDAYLAKYPSEGPKRDQLMLMKAELYFKTQQYAAATPLYESLRDSELVPALKSEALFRLGWCEAETGDYGGAVQAFSDFLAKYPTHKLASVALAQRGFSFERAKNYKAAIADYDEVLTRFPKAAREREFALLRKGLILGQQDELRAMSETFHRLLKEFPKSEAAGRANYWIGYASFQVKDYRAAVQPLREARKHDKEFADRASSLLLAALLYIEDRDGLAEEVAQAGEKVRIPAEAYRWLGTAYLKDPAPESAAKAEGYLQKLTALDNPDEQLPEDWLKLGQAQLKQERWPEAVTTVTTYLTKVSDPIPQANGYLALGEAQRGAGQLDEAFASAAKVQQLQPEGRLNAQGRMLAGSILERRNDLENAVKTYMGIAVVFDDPGITPRALERAYQVYLKQGNEEEAKKVLNRLQSRFPEYRLSAATL